MQTLNIYTHGAAELERAAVGVLLNLLKQVEKKSTGTDNQPFEVVAKNHSARWYIFTPPFTTIVRIIAFSSQHHRKAKALSFHLNGQLQVHEHSQTSAIYSFYTSFLL